MENRTTIETGKNIYLYCFFKGPSFLIPQEGIDGINATMVFFYRDLCALVSPVAIDEYNEQTLNRQIEDLGWIVPKVKRHDDIVRYVMEFHHPVIPVRFGTIYTSNERLLGVMRNGYDELCSCLDFLDGKEEWGVKVYAKEGAGGKVMEDFSKPIRQLDREISSATPGQAYLLRKKRAELVRQQSDSVFDNIAREIYQLLLSWSIKGRRNKLLSKRATGKESEMILNAAFLINKLDVAVFKEKIDLLADSYERDAFSFGISGPWPCYNFCPEFKSLTDDAKT